MIVLETERLNLRWFDIQDAPFILELVNDPAWIQFIGDKGVTNLEDAKKYILNGPVDMYNKMGFGLYLVERKEDFTPLGMCGLIKRDSLEDVDIGFAFLEKFRSKGYGFESASAVIDYGVQKLGLKRIVAITTIDNINSGKLLEKIGLQFEEIISDSGEDLKLFGYNI
ncbi:MULTISPECIES: GNAT family N-acetyltransferase [Bacillus]|uniref:N-acetyltransferase n=2 Tax=Bacillus cereus group TaxID=86661 RepID=A0A2A7D3H9_BACAN|nr:MULTISPECIES: GNAT family N-acetyltransferase [Bacillus]MCP1164621.1 GNAT family N-acetyltransferase [Bacillus sp. 1813sda1]MDC7971540.1 GNAT family N-acetyltransferase [Bacillus sp. BLCC-B18]OTW71146.1 alanine acetyltransferase [Bacillus thuringiensis serovar coreanensis]OTX41462.1 alanine acetyltransferase [Bacillus thuringiensis serovar sooncheon]OTX47464.1 alanine acetyltransferase [Bacillus thuringiensis serovar guiyangiensis]